MSRKYVARTPQPKGVFGRPPEYLFESDIREAMSQTPSNGQAAKYLRVSYPTYKKYAKEYIDSETGKTLFDMHRSTGKGVKRFRRRDFVSKVHKIINGEITVSKRYDKKMKFIKDLIKAMIFEEKCAICGWNDKRPVDLTTPLLLDFLDGNEANYLKNNIRLICPNCYSIHVGDTFHSRGFRTQYQRPLPPKKEIRPDQIIKYDTLDLDKPLTPEEIANLDLSKL